MQGSDLRRLLEMYERWQHNLFPSLKFDDFVAGVEKIGRTAEVKVRSDVLNQFDAGNEHSLDVKGP